MGWVSSPHGASFLTSNTLPAVCCLVENPLIDNQDEQELSTDVERDLTELATCISNMRDYASAQNSGSRHTQEALIKRYNEIHYDYSTEFKNTLNAVNRKRENMELFHSSKSTPMEEQDSSMAKLLRERSGIAASMKSINDVISQAFDTKSALGSQRTLLSGAGSGLSSLSTSMPSFNRLIDGIQRKKYRESFILAVVVGVLVCFSLWWVLLR